MPLACRTILPQWLGRRTLREEDETENIAQIAVCHNAVLGVIVQLASLIRHADDLFCDLTEECQRVFEKTESISGKLCNIKGIISQLDSTEVKIPIGTLTDFSALTDHHVAKHGFDCDHFTPNNRPYCIRFNYSMCELTPAHILNGVDPLRKDGRISSHLFKLWPIALKDIDVHRDDLILPRRYSTSMSQKKRYKSLKVKERRRTIQVIDDIHRKESSELQAGNTEQLSKSQPSILVAVDTTGSGFERMTMFRQSLNQDDVWRRSGRRRTVSGVPSVLMQEIEQFEEDRRTLRHGPRRYSLDDLDDKDIDERDELMQQHLLDMDSAITEREEEEYAEQRERKLLKFIPCRRTRSLPRCVKLLTARGCEEFTLSSMLPKKKHHKLVNEEVRPKLNTNEQNFKDKFSSNTTLGSSNGDDAKSSRSSKRSSLIGSKIMSIVTNTLKQRPKSLDFDSIDVIEAKGRKIKENKLQRKSVSLNHGIASSGTEGTKLTRTPSSESQVGPGSYYYFDNHTLPRAQAKKYDFPWDSLPKDWTTFVKLREISKGRKEDRQSSSGNWSQSGYSSNRQSLDSDTKNKLPSSMSQNSIGRDSGRDSIRSSGERDGLDAGYMGDAASTESVSDTKSVSNTDSEDWIRSLAEQAASRRDVTSTSAEALANLSQLTKQNIYNLDALIPGRFNFRQKRNELEDDGESSVYSIDQEGFYTSFHTDSGLKKSTNTLYFNEDDDLMMPTVRESRSMQNVTSSITMKDAASKSETSSSNTVCQVDGVAFANDQVSDVTSIDFSNDSNGEVEYGMYGTLKAKKKTNKKKKIPPLPPPRTVSINCNNTSNVIDEGLSRLDDSPSSIETSSESSDHETIYARLKTKTGISAHTYPSWCVGIASDEDDRLNAESSEVDELFSGKESWLSGTLPRTSAPTDVQTSNDFDQINSWPRVKRVNSLQLGILKSNEKDKTKNTPSNPKVLNFDPVVNLFDAHSPHSVQMPLSRLSSSDEGSSPVPAIFDDHPLSHKYSSSSNEATKEPSHDALPHKQISNKYPARPWSMILNPREMLTSSSSSTPTHNHQLASDKAHLFSTDLSVVYSSSSTRIDLMDSFDTTLTAHDKSGATLTSNSTIALSDIDSSSLTYITMSGFSTSGSSLSLNWDTDDTPNPTPMATPIRKQAPISSSHASSSTKPTTDKKSCGSVSSVQQFIIKDISSVQKANEPSLLGHPSSTLSSTLYSSSNNKKESNGKPKHLRCSLPTPGSIHEHDTPTDKSPNHHHEPGFTTNIATSHFAIGQFSNGSSSSISSNNSTESDSNNNKNKSVNSTSLQSLKVKTDPIVQSTIDKTAYHQDAVSPHSSHIHHLKSGPSIGNPQLYQQSTNIAYQSSLNERKQSIFNKDQVMDSSSFSSSNRTENISVYKNNGSSIDKRRHSDNRLYSPADRGYGSSSVTNQPVITTSSYAPPQTSQPNFSSTSLTNSFPTSNISSVTPLIKEQQLRDSRTTFADSAVKPHISNTIRPDFSAKIMRQSSTQSNESLNSQFSVSSTQQLIPKIQKPDLSLNPLHRENSNESVHSNGSGSRSDSYRVAMTVNSDEISLIPNKTPNIPSHLNNKGNIPENNARKNHIQVSKSLIIPAPAMSTDDVVSRADSYRCAVRHTQSMLLGDSIARNASYRLATCEDDVVITDSRMDSCNLWTGKTGGTRDSRRMGITDIDQLKQYNKEPNNNGKLANKHNMAKNLNTLHVKKKLSTRPESETIAYASKQSQSELKRSLKPSSKDKAKQKTQSSTYIRFDPIFESGEDLRASCDSLRPPSIVSIRTLAKAESNETLTSENMHLIKQKTGSMLPTRKRSSSQGRRDDRSGLSIFGSIKTTIKSIGGSKVD